MAYLGIDIGTSTVKAGILGDDGRWVVRACPVNGAEFALRSGEIDAKEWWIATCEALRLVGELVDLRTIEAVAVIGNTPTLICVNEEGEPVAPALLWSDTRAHNEAQELLREHTQAEWNTVYGGFIPVSAAYPSAKLRWMQHNWRHVLQMTAKVIQPKDFVNNRLTSVLAGDVWTSKGLLSLNSVYGTKPLEYVGLDPHYAPDCYRPIDCIGTVTNSASLVTGIPRNTPVMAGWSDTLGAVLSLGLTIGDAFILSGTSDSVGILTHQEADETQNILCAPIWDSGYFIAYGPTSSGMSTVQWAETTLGVSLRTPSNSVLRPERPVFVPYLLGQRSPVWNDGVRGTWVNMDIHTTAEELADAVLEGVVAAERDVLEAVCAATGKDVDRIVLSGGGSEVSRLNYWRLSLFEAPVYKTSAEPVLGAALIAFWGIQKDTKFPTTGKISAPWIALPPGAYLPNHYKEYQFAKAMALRFASTV